MMPIIEQHVSLIAHMHTHITRLQDILPIALHRNIREREREDDELYRNPSGCHRHFKQGLTQMDSKACCWDCLFIQAIAAYTHTKGFIFFPFTYIGLW